MAASRRSRGPAAAASGRCSSARKSGLKICGWRCTRTGCPCRPAFVCLVATIYHHVPGVTHAISFSDAAAAVAAINAETSGSPQMHALLAWFYELCPGLQSLAVWIEGRFNTRADSLSRGAGEAVVREVSERGWEPHALPPPPGAFDVLRRIAALPHSE